MAVAFNLTSPRFPNGTSVGAYPKSNWPNDGEPSGAPLGSAAQTKTVTGGTAAFTVLTDNTEYWAAAEIDGAYRYVGFIAGADLAESDQSGGLSQVEIEEIIREVVAGALTEEEIKTLIEELVGSAGLTEAEVTAIAESVLGGLNAFSYKGAIDCSSNPKFPAADAGDTYTVSVAGKIGGASGSTVAVADLLICNTDSSAEGTKAEVGSKWNIINAQVTVEAGVKVEKERAETAEGLRELLSNKDTTGTLGTSDTKYPSQKAVKTYADTKVEGPASATDSHILVADGTTGKKAKDGGKTIAEIVAGEGIIGALGEAGKALSAVDPSLDKSGVSVLEAPYSAKGNAKRVTDGAITSGQKTLSSTEAVFTSADVGKRVDVVGAGAAGVNLLAEISSVSSGVATLSVAASTTVTGKMVTYGTDDSEAVQKCMNAVSKAGGGVVILPQGRKFLINWVVPMSNVTVWAYGATIYFSTFNVAEGAKQENAGFSLQTSIPKVVSLASTTEGQPAVNFSIYGATMPGDGVSVTSGIRTAVWMDVAGSDNIRIKDCKVDENKDSAFSLFQVTRAWIVDNTITNCCTISHRNAINIGLETTPAQSHDILIQGNHVENCPTECITVGTKGGASITTFPARVKIIGNTVVSENCNGIDVESSFSGAGGGQANVVIANNIVRVTGSTASRFGIVCTNGGGNKCGPNENIIIADNVVSHYNIGIEVSNTRYATVEGNTVSDTTKAGVSTNCPTLAVTGTTTENSTSLTEVSIPGETERQPQNGSRVTGTGISEGTYIVSGAGTATWVLSQKATSTNAATTITVQATSEFVNITGNVVSMPKNAETAAISAFWLSHSIVSGNVCIYPTGSTEKEARGIWLENSHNVDVKGNRIENAPMWSINIAQSHDIPIKNNTCRNGGQKTAGVGIKLKGANVISIEGNNIFDDQAASTLTYAVETNGSFNSKVKVKNNEIFGATNAAPIAASLTAMTAISGNEMEQEKNNPIAITAITVGESPYVYKNEDAFPQSVIVQGGTVSAIEISRNSGSTYFKTGAIAGITVLRPGDWLKVTWSVKPTMDKVPI